MRIAFTGNPNSGKTTMYNALTGRNEKVGNWAGVTVEKKESPIKKAYWSNEELIAVDLPGAYSMSPFTSEESITSTFQSHLKSIVAEYSMTKKMNGCINIVSCDDVRYVQHDDGTYGNKEGKDNHDDIFMTDMIAALISNSMPMPSVARGYGEEIYHGTRNESYF